MNAHRLPQSTALLGIIILLALQACMPVPSPTAEPVVETPAATAIPLSKQVSSTFINLREEGQSPAYVITASTPKLSGLEHPHVEEFNKKASKLIQQEIQYFRENILEQAALKPVSSGSSFTAQYALISQRDEIWSYKFDFYGYADGASLPFHYSLTLNFDLAHGHELAIGELFPPDSKYLEVLSQYCIAELSKRNIGFYGGFRQGAEPTAENYRNWNFTADGLMITFDEMRVAPYSAGSQTVTVPFAEMETLIKPKSPLALYKP